MEETMVELRIKQNETVQVFYFNPYTKMYENGVISVSKNHKLTWKQLQDVE